MSVTRLSEGSAVHSRLGASASEKERTWRGDKEGGYPGKENRMSKGGVGQVPVAWGGDAKWGAWLGWTCHFCPPSPLVLGDTRQTAHAVLAWVQ